ncbi:MAG: helix-turn-helix transcriptional regulator [Candidatus Limiplasma sp.]|nr:helix-turn-helix transcriptional regulator [Candidatus Limiplasma sp.]
MDQVKTGELIRLLRQKQGLTQLALASQIGVSDKAVSKWERGVSLR